eukprot:SAG11_NODE_16_length_26235_cov_39.900417_17_plen_217_part_00
MVNQFLSVLDSEPLPGSRGEAEPEPEPEPESKSTPPQVPIVGSSSQMINTPGPSPPRGQWSILEGRFVPAPKASVGYTMPPVIDAKRVISKLVLSIAEEASISSTAAVQSFLRHQVDGEIHEYRYMTLGMYYEIREDNLYYDYILYHHHRAAKFPVYDIYRGGCYLFQRGYNLALHGTTVFCFRLRMFQREASHGGGGAETSVSRFHLRDLGENII